MAYKNTWTNISDSDGSKHTSQEYEDARFNDRHCGHECKCGGQFQYRPTVGCMQCTKCGEIEICC